ncbi:hypothetical protein NMG60_11014173 [Bertholletia excelsa]
MDSRLVVLDISSDEECAGDNYDWISEFLDADDDDVVLVNEVVLNKQRSNKRSIFPSKPLVNDLDDDCVVLDGDPDKPAVIENDSAGESDDLLVVGERGQIACRDFPHARHTCASFLFDSTPHESHCHQCHCYVCDSLAPCTRWGNGTSRVDHCHATDKDEFWNQSNPVAQNQIGRPTTIRACSASSNFGNSNARNHSRSHPSVNVSSRNKLIPHNVSQQLHVAHSNSIQRDRRHPLGSVGPQLFSPPSFSKGKDQVVSGNNTHIARHSRNLSSVAASNKNPTGWHDFSTGITSQRNPHQNPSQQNTGGSFGISGPSYPQVSSYLNNSSVCMNSVPCQPQVPSQPKLGDGFISSVAFQQPLEQQNPAGNFESSVPSPVEESSHPNMDSSFIDPVSSEHQVYGQRTYMMNINQDGSQQQGNETQIAFESFLSDFDPSWINTTGQSNPQPLTDNFQVQGVGETYHNPFFTEFDQQFPVNTNPVSVDYNWMVEDQTVAGPLEVPLYSPGPPPVDAGGGDPCDYECMAHAHDSMKTLQHH